MESQKSVFNFAKNIISIRKELKAVECGKYEMILNDDPQVLAYKREFEGHELIVVSNFFENETKVNYDLDGFKVLANNYKEQVSLENVILKPYQTIIFYKWWLLVVPFTANGD